MMSNYFFKSSETWTCFYNAISFCYNFNKLSFVCAIAYSNCFSLLAISSDFPEAFICDIVSSFTCSANYSLRYVTCAFRSSSWRDNWLICCCKLIFSSEQLSKSSVSYLHFAFTSARLCSASVFCWFNAVSFLFKSLPSYWLYWSCFARVCISFSCWSSCSCSSATCFWFWELRLSLSWSFNCCSEHWLSNSSIYCCFSCSCLRASCFSCMYLDCRSSWAKSSYA